MNGKITKENVKAFLIAAMIRAIKTSAQTALALISPVIATGGEINIKNVVLTSLLAGAYSLITNLATGLPEISVSELPEGN